MNGLMMDFQLTLPTLLRRAETYFGDKEIVTRLPDKSFHRYTYPDMARRAKQLAVALGELGLERGDRVATLSWMWARAALDAESPLIINILLKCA